MGTSRQTILSLFICHVSVLGRAFIPDEQHFTHKVFYKKSAMCVYVCVCVSVCLSVCPSLSVHVPFEQRYWGLSGSRKNISLHSEPPSSDIIT